MCKQTTRLVRALALPLCLSAFGTVARAQMDTRACLGKAAKADKTLDIHVTDTESWKGTHLVSPTGETVLVDTRNPGDRDLARIMDMIHSARVTRIDHLLSTHYHTDHVGGLTEIAKRDGGAAGTATGNAARSPAYVIRISALRNGTFTVTNLRDSFSKTYQKR